MKAATPRASPGFPLTPPLPSQRVQPGRASGGPSAGAAFPPPERLQQRPLGPAPCTPEARPRGCEAFWRQFTLKWILNVIYLPIHRKARCLNLEFSFNFSIENKFHFGLQTNFPSKYRVKKKLYAIKFSGSHLAPGHKGTVKALTTALQLSCGSLYQPSVRLEENLRAGRAFEII